MTTNDPIADMLTRIRNANTAKHDTVDVPASKMKIAIADILVDEGYIAKYELVDDGAFKAIRITLKYGKDKNERIISGLKRISKPGLSTQARMICRAFSVVWALLSFPRTRASSPTNRPENSASAAKYWHLSGKRAG